MADQSALPGMEAGRRAERVDAKPCSLDVQWLGYWGKKPTGIACGEPSCATARLTCKHEYRADAVRICSGCATGMQQASGQITCKRCWDAGDRLVCYMAVSIEWDSGELTIVQGVTRA
jgi:hypothetical protein